MATDDFFRARLDAMIDLRHPMAVLAVKMPRPEIEAALAPVLAHRDRKVRLVEGAGPFGTTAQLAEASVSKAGRPRLSIRLMVALLYLKHAFDLSDEEKRKPKTRLAPHRAAYSGPSASRPSRLRGTAEAAALTRSGTAARVRPTTAATKGGSPPSLPARARAARMRL